MESNNAENFEPRESSIEDETDEKVFQDYVEILKLKPEDFEKKILDVGAGTAQFAKWAKEHGVSSEIYSLEPIAGRARELEKSVVGKAEVMPFRDNSFDLVISNGAIPNFYIGGEKVAENVAASFSEMIRVLKPGGEIRLSPVLLGDIYESQKVLAKAIADSLAEVERHYGVIVEKIRTPAGNTHEYEADGHTRKRTLAEAYRIVIKKPL